MSEEIKRYASQSTLGKVVDLLDRAIGAMTGGLDGIWDETTDPLVAVRAAIALLDKEGDDEVRSGKHLSPGDRDSSDVILHEL